MLSFTACEVHENPIEEKAAPPESALFSPEPFGSCGPSVFLPIGNATGNYGTAEVGYHQPDEILAVFVSLDWEFVVHSVSIPGGPALEFPGTRSFYFPIPVATLGCQSYIAEMVISEIDFFGSPYNFQTVWIKGVPTPAGGYAFEFCANHCLEVEILASGTCIAELPGYGKTADCVTLTANVTLGTAASYLWSTGETTPSITVCPTATTSYTVNVSNGAYLWVPAAVTIGYQTLEAPCGVGGDKIQICHYPPGGGGSGATQCKPSAWLFNYLDTHGGLSALVPGASDVTLGPCGAPLVPCGI